MYFEIVGPIANIERITVGTSIRQLAPPEASLRPWSLA